MLLDVCVGKNIGSTNILDSEHIAAIERQTNKTTGCQRTLLGPKTVSACTAEWNYITANTWELAWRLKCCCHVLHGSKGSRSVSLIDVPRCIL
jgi:hypothetical protein